MPKRRKLKLAILDMYNNAPNEGMRCLKSFGQSVRNDVDWQVFDVRAKGEVPDKGFDIYISSGGPGSPFDGEGQVWEKQYFNLIDALWAHNANGHANKKYLFAICHSFQMLSRHFALGNVSPRKKTAFGVFPIFKTEESKRDMHFRNLPDPYYVVDSRDWQLVEPDLPRFAELGATILSMEKKREHVPLPRAVMAVRLSNYMYMTQFHPEADAEGMLRHFAKPERRNSIVEHHGEQKLDEMIQNLTDTNKLPLTHGAIIPTFLRSSINALHMQD